MLEQKETFKKAEAGSGGSKLWILIFAVGIVLGVVIGYAGGVYFNKNSFQQGVIQGRKEMEGEYQEKLKEFFPSLEGPEEIYSVYGEIVSIEERVLTLKQEIPPGNPLKGPVTKTWTVEVTDETEIIKLVERTLEEMEASGEELPEPFSEVEIKFSELEQGDLVRIRSAEDIKDKVQFEAERIEIETILEPVVEGLPEEMPEGF